VQQPVSSVQSFNSIQPYINQLENSENEEQHSAEAEHPDQSFTIWIQGNSDPPTNNPDHINLNISEDSFETIWIIERDCDRLPSVLEILKYDPKMIESIFNEIEDEIERHKKKLHPREIRYILTQITGRLNSDNYERIFDFFRHFAAVRYNYSPRNC